MTKIIGIHGKAWSGKDTVAEHLVSKYGYKQYAFADPMYKMLEVIGVYNVGRHEKERPHPIYGVSLRHMLQELGDAWGRERINKDVWVIAAQMMMQGDPEDTKYVISDIRRENEADLVRKKGGFVIHLQRNELPKVREHGSEEGIEFKAGDVRLENNGSLLDLYLAVDRLLE